MEPIKEYKLAGYIVRLFANRIEVQQGSLFGKRIETILLRTITNVACGVGQVLTLATIDGKTHRLNIGGKAAEEWRQKILEVMP